MIGAPDGNAGVALVVGAEREIAGGIEVFERRVFRHDAHGADAAVTAVDRALRTAQHLDAIDVEEVDQRADALGVVHVVDVDADRRVERERRVRLTDAAHEQLRRAGVRQVLLEVEAGDDVLDVGEAERQAGIEVVGAQGGERDRHGLGALGHALGGHHHVLQGVFGARLGMGGKLSQQTNRRGEERGNRTTHWIPLQCEVQISYL